MVTALLVGCSLDFLSPADESNLEPVEPTAQPTATPDEAAEFVAYLNPRLGVALQHPPAWVIRDGQPLMLASDAELFDSTAGVTTGALVAIAPMNLAPEEDLVDALTNLIGMPEGTRIIEPAASKTINGQAAARLILIGIDEDGIEYTSLYQMMRHQGATVLVSAVTPDHTAFQPLLEAMLDTVIVSAPMPTAAPPTLTPQPAPTAPPPDETPEAEPAEEGEGEAALAVLQVPVPADFVQFVDPQNRYSIGRPPAWLINSEEPDAVIMASSELLLNDNVFSEAGAAVWLFPQALAAGTDPDPVLILEQFIANFPIYDSFEPLELPRPLLINGQAGAASRYDVTIGGAPSTAEYYVAVRESRFVVLVGLISEEEAVVYAPLIEAMAASLNVRP